MQRILIFFLIIIMLLALVTAFNLSSPLASYNNLLNAF